jgi:hypothetical protein
MFHTHRLTRIKKKLCIIISFAMVRGVIALQAGRKAALEKNNCVTRGDTQQYSHCTPSLPHHTQIHQQLSVTALYTYTKGDIHGNLFSASN